MKKTAFLGLFTAFAIVLSAIELMIPSIIPIPGFKIGLANLAFLLALYLFGFKEGLCVNLVRIILVALLFTSMYGLMYSVAGAIFSMVIEYILYKSGKFSAIGVSVAGAIFHNLGQCLVAFIVTGTVALVYYLPILCLFGIVTGVVIGIITNTLIPKLKLFLDKEPTAKKNDILDVESIDDEDEEDEV
jgi:heptaprenyl diphosphate synthase